MMKSLARLHQSILRDVGSVVSVDTARDELTLTRRGEAEGESFYTITLPSFAKALEESLAAGSWQTAQARSFDHLRGLPRLFGGFLLRIFAPDGTILDDPDADAIWAIRQVCYLTSKIERECTPARVDRAFESYLDTDASVPTDISSFDVSHLYWYQEAAKLFRPLFASLDRQVAEFALMPKHGPGSVSDRLTHPERAEFTYWTERLESVFPSWRYRSNLPLTLHPEPVEPCDEIPVRVVHVPKTQKTPRIIAIEPSTVQYAQQGLKEAIYEEVSRSEWNDILGFTDQGRNQKLAKEASIHRGLATLDLSEASDRVSVPLVALLTAEFPHLGEYLEATRSKVADVRGVHHPIRKFASMGSALTFPIEAIVFTTIIISVLLESGVKVPNARKLRDLVSVYGDDLIVPTVHTSAVIERLEAFGLKVNRSKSFWTGKFRESCGEEYYDGHEVSVVRLRHEVPSSPTDDATLIESFASFRNRAYSAGLWKTVRLADEILSKITLWRAVPRAEIHIAKVSFLPPVAPDRIHPTLHREEWKVPFVKTKSVDYRYDGHYGLYEWFRQKRSVRPVGDYERQERPVASRILYRWSPSY
jgi:hypothetical protein